MRVLALDTTTARGSCALAHDGVVHYEHASDGHVSPAKRLPLELMALLEAAGTTLDEIDVYAVAVGPGSFTGLRVGIATMQGLAFAAAKPLVGISGLDALAACVSDENDRGSPFSSARAATWVDAWRGEVYAALYAEGRQLDAPSVELPAVLLARLQDAPTIFIGDGAVAHAELIERTLGSLARIASSPTPLLAGTIATMATDAARTGHQPDASRIQPLYVRRPDAELARDARAATRPPADSHPEAARSRP